MSFSAPAGLQAEIGQELEPPSRLSSLVRDLRSNRIEVGESVDSLETKFEAVDTLVEAFVPEEQRFERLRADAAQLAQSWGDSDHRPPLFGVPIGVKDIFQVDGLPITGGSRLPPEVLRGPQGTCIERLRNAGGLLLGKTVSTEFAYFAPGPTHNPWSLGHTPGGSSSGSAAAVAAGLAPLTLGTQTIGSVARPASFCGVTGFKPSFGRIPTDGVIPLSPSLDHIGCFTSDVEGCQLFAAICCNDWRSIDQTLQLPVLGIPRGPYLEHCSPSALASFERTTRSLSRTGYRLRQVDVLANFDQIISRHRNIVAGEAARVHHSWFDEFRDLYDVRTCELIETGQAIDQESLTKLLSSRGQLRRALESAMTSAGVDLLVTPSAVGTAPRGLDSTGDPVMNLPWSHAGVPTITLPTETLDVETGVTSTQLPVAIQLVGLFGEDETLLAHARRIEEALS